MAAITKYSCLLALVRGGVLALMLLGLSAAPAQRQNQLPPPSEMKPVGLVGGMSWYSTVEYYGYINRAINDAYGNNTNPPVIVYNVNQRHINDLQAQGKWDEVASYLADAVEHLRASGALAIVLCSNTSHKVSGQISKRTGVPILHIGDATGTAIRQQGLTKVGLIGTRYTMEDEFMTKWLKEKYGVEVVIPESPAVRKELDRIIHDELGMGIFKPESKNYILQEMEALRRRGAQGIVLGCTEFPLVIKQKDSPIPIFDTTLLHSQMAVDFIVGKPGLAHVQPSP